MSIQNFKVRNGLNVNSQLVIDGNANAYFNSITANTITLTSGSVGLDQFARNTANSAGIYANTGITLAQAAFNQANTGGGSGLDQYARDTANSAGIYANTGINNAASASQYANTGINNAASASLYANTGVNNAASASAYANTGINNAASASVYANTGINNAASASLYANAGITLAQASFNQGNSTATVANTAINNAASASQYANTAINNSASASSYANAGITLAQAAYNQGNSTAIIANTKFDSAGGTITGNVTISGNNNLVVTGNLFVQGNTVTTNTQSFVVADPVILLASGNFYTDAKDIGFAAHYNDGTNAHTGFIRDYVTKEYYIFDNYTPELDANNEININDASFREANVHAGFFKGNVIANTAVVDGIDVTNYIQSSYNQANTGVNNAASASLYANTGITLAQAAYNAQNSTAIVANAAVTATSTTTLTNKRITLRTANNGATLSGNLTPDSDTTDQYNIIGITGTTNIQIPSGTPTEGQKLIIRIKDGGVAQTLTWITTAGGYRVIGTTLPTTTTASKVNYVGCVYNSQDSYWDVVAVSTQS